MLVRIYWCDGKEGGKWHWGIENRQYPAFTEVFYERGLSQHSTYVCNNDYLHTRHEGLVQQTHANTSDWLGGHGELSPVVIYSLQFLGCGWRETWSRLRADSAPHRKSSSASYSSQRINCCLPPCVSLIHLLPQNSDDKHDTISGERVWTSFSLSTLKTRGPKSKDWFKQCVDLPQQVSYFLTSLSAAVFVLSFKLQLKIKLCVLCWLVSNFSSLSLFLSGGADEAAGAAARPVGGSASRRVRGRHRQPVLPAEHRHHRHRQHHPEGRQGAGPPQLWHGLHPDGRHHQREYRDGHTWGDIIILSPAVILYWRCTIFFAQTFLIYLFSCSTETLEDH